MAGTKIVAPVAGLLKRGIKARRTADVSPAPGARHRPIVAGSPRPLAGQA